MGCRIRMENQRIFFSKKENVYYYVTYGEFPNCNACHKEVNRTLVYHTSWRKSGDEVRIYHIGCYQKISLRGVIDEFKTCVVTDKMPEEAHPVFERSPSLANSNGASTFEVSKILRGSEAEVKDRAKVSKDPGQYIDPHYQKNLKMFEKKEKELGYSAFLLQELKRDEIMQIEHQKKKEDQITCKVVQIKKDSIEVETLKEVKLFIEKDELPLSPKNYNQGQEICLGNEKVKVVQIKKDSIEVKTLEKVRVTINRDELPLPPEKYEKDQEVIARFKNSDKSIILSFSLKRVDLLPRERVYQKENKIKEVNIHDFLEEAKNLYILLPHQDPLELSFSKSNQKNIEDKSN